ncbi:hypothetical protein CVT25_007280 [Psilocybe cyanescens]|uniref:Uncharacterized protein n=1 Tax=Psilocybe cyanescens TaxID=93625 RepID=A0A409XPA8_PSICY|nr:hypothetical protein CVT25_007280 [Psilocybe cyanescens]
MASIIRAAPVSRVTALVPLRMAGGMRMGYATSPSKESLSAKKDNMSQGNVNDSSNLHQKSVHSESAKGGKGTRKDDSGGALDAASPGKKTKPKDRGKGNPEGVGMVDQVGSAGGSAEHFEKKPNKPPPANYNAMNTISRFSKLIPQRIARPFSTATLSKRSTMQIVPSLAQDALYEQKDCMSQGHVTDSANKHPNDTQSQSVRSAMAARSSGDNFSIDAASPNIRPDPADRTLGNPEGIGMLEQVGSASATAAFFNAGGKQGDGPVKKDTNPIKEFLKSAGFVDSQPSFTTIRTGWAAAVKYKLIGNQDLESSDEEHADDSERFDMDAMRNTDPSTWSKNTKRNLDEMTKPTNEELAAEILDLEYTYHTRFVIEKEQKEEARKRIKMEETGPDTVMSPSNELPHSP